MDDRGRKLLAAAGTTGLFVLVQLGALAIVQPFAAAEFRPPSDPTDPTNSVLYFVAILVATGTMLAAIRLGIQGVIRALVLGTSGLLTWVVGTVLVERLVPVAPGSLVAGAFALTMVGLLYWYPEWYVIDGAAVVMGAGSAGLFGITFGVLPAIVLLVILAVYDAVSVYGTEHMLTLADNAMELRIPVLFVVPTTLSYSFLGVEDRLAADRREAAGDGGGPVKENGVESGLADGNPEDDGVGADDRGTVDGGHQRSARENAPDGTGEPDAGSGLPPSRDALFVGLGDAVMPTILAVSAAFFLDVPRFDLPILLNAPALGALVGTLLGLSALQWLVFRGRAHAGLPLLNGGAIAGYLAGAVVAGVPILEALGVSGFV